GGRARRATRMDACSRVAPQPTPRGGGRAYIGRAVGGAPQKCPPAVLPRAPPAVNSALQRARARLRERLPSRKPAWPADTDASAAERDLLKKYVEAGEAADFQALASIIRADATLYMPPEPGLAEGRDAIFQLWREGGYGSEGFGRLRCVLTHANLQPAVACYRCQPGDSNWR